RPEFEFDGEGYLKIFGAEIHGKGGIRSIPSPYGGHKKDFFEAYMEGDLGWHGRKWLAGKVSVGSKGLCISGSTNLGLNITPTNIPGTPINIASLFLNLKLDGEFRLNSGANKVTFLFNGYWTLGIALAGADNNTSSNQMLPLASSQFAFDSNFGLELPIFKFDGFKMLPIKGVNIPVPSVDITPIGGPAVKVGRYDNDPANNKRDWIPAVEFKAPSPVNSIRADTIPFYVHTDDPKEDWHNNTLELYSAYDTNVNWDNVYLDFENLDNLQLSIALKDDDTKNFPLKLILSLGPGNKTEISL
ncbi:MAG: hypothetical protein ACR2MX_19920, partial [Cyclobacteriaceae bacterium]